MLTILIGLVVAIVVVLALVAINAIANGYKH